MHADQKAPRQLGLRGEVEDVRLIVVGGPQPARIAALRAAQGISEPAGHAAALPAQQHLQTARGAIGDTPIIARAQGIPVKAVAVLGSGSLMQLVTHKDERIESPRELKGKTVTVLAYTDTTYYALLGMLSKVGLTKNDVNIQAAGPAGVWQLFAGGKAQAMAGTADWIAEVEATGTKVDVHPSGEYFPSMAQAILASDEAIRSRPETVQKVVRATLKGLKYMLDDPKGSVAAFVQAVPAYAGKEAMLERAFALARQHVYGGQKVLGQVDAARLDAVQKFYVDEAIVPKATPLAELYTNQFIGK